jgi:mRNA interferase YafQ
MRRIERTNAFRSDFKREKRGQHRRDLDTVLMFAVSLLADDKPLPERNHDHALGGDWRDHRECHLKPNLLLIYRKPDAEVLQLVRLGSHSELFG